MSAESRIKKQKKKERERKAKTLLKLRLGMDTPTDIGIDASNFVGEEPEEFGLAGPAGSGLFSHDSSKVRDKDVFFILQASISKSDSAFEEIDSESNEANDSKSEVSDDDLYMSSDEEAELKLQSRETDLNRLYENFKQSQMERDPIAHARAEKKESKLKAKKNLKEQFNEWYGVEYDKKKSEANQSGDGVGSASSASDENDVGDEDLLFTDSESENGDPFDQSKMSDRAKTFFDNAVFKSLDSETHEEIGDQKRKRSAPKSLFEKELELLSSDEEDDEIRKMNSKKKRKSSDVLDNMKKKDFEVVAKDEDFANNAFSDGSFFFILEFKPFQMTKNY
jgi:AdoMet-dependent rRNA methyltransferase SPB1